MTRSRGIASIVAGFGAATALAVIAAAGPAAADLTTIPYTDHGSSGQITLCDAAGNALTHGSTTTTPFVTSAHTTFAAPKPYDGPGHSATLLAYQPRQGVDPGNWSGMALSAASIYSDVRHPTAALTSADDGLDQMIQSYPPVWDGLLQLRVYLGAANQPGDNVQYASETLQVSVDGSSWTALDPGSLPCSEGHATSVEDSLQIPQIVAARSASASAAAAAERSAHPGGPPPRPADTRLVTALPTSVAASVAHGPAAGAGDVGNLAPSTAASSTAAGGDAGGGGHSALYAGIMGVLLVGGGSFWLGRRGRSRA